MLLLKVRRRETSHRRKHTRPGSIALTGHRGNYRLSMLLVFYLNLHIDLCHNNYNSYDSIDPVVYSVFFMYYVFLILRKFSVVLMAFIPVEWNIGASMFCHVCLCARLSVAKTLAFAITF